MNKFVKYGSLAVLGASLFVSGANAAEVIHNQENAKAPFASSTMVPPGYNMFFISGSTGKGADTAEQTAATLANLKAQMAKLGLLPSAISCRRMSFWRATPTRAARWISPG